jgi:uncharacterized membrane protein
MDNFPTATPSAPGTAPPPRDGWAVAAGRGVDWWTSGWRLFTKAPVIWIAIVVVFSAIMFALSLVPFLGAIAQTLLYPVLGAGVLLGARALDRGGELTLGHLFACFNDKAMPLVIVALLYLGGWFVIWLGAAALLFAVLGFGTLSSFVSALASNDPTEMWVAMASMLSVSVLVVLLVAVLAALPLVMAYWFAPALVLFRGDEPIASMRTSFTACMRNMPPFLLYGLVGIGFAIVATIPVLLGWLVLLPVYAASLYTSYKDIFGEPP